MNKQRTQSPNEGYTQEYELFLLRLRYKEGRLFKAGHNRPIILNNPNHAWVIYKGKIDIFAVPLINGQIAGTRTHIARLEAGSFFFGLDFSEQTGLVGLLAIGTMETETVRLKRERLEELGKEEGIREHILQGVEQWVITLYTGVVNISPPPLTKLTIKLVTGQEITLFKGMAAYPKRELVWFKLLSGKLNLLGREIHQQSIWTSFFPLASPAWIMAIDGAWLEIEDTDTLLLQDKLWPALNRFHNVFIWLTDQYVHTSDKAEQNRLTQKLKTTHHTAQSALSNLATVLAPADQFGLIDVDPDSAPLLAACQLIGNAMHIRVTTGSNTMIVTKGELQAIATASQMRVRKIALRGQWWQHDVEPTLGFLKLSEAEDIAGQDKMSRPVAILPALSGQGYEIVDPVNQTHTPVDADTVQTLDYFGYTFYRSLPNQAVGLKEMIKLGLRGLRRDTLTILVTVIAGGFLGLVAPVTVGILFDSVVPQANVQLLGQLALMLVLASAVSALIQLTRGVAILRLETQVAARLQAALWDRLLRLPVNFFRHYAAGDLAVRAQGINRIKRILSGSVLRAGFGGFTAFFNLLLMFYYSVVLGAVALGLVLLATVVTAIIGAFALRYQRRQIRLGGQISGMVLELLGGMSKFRVTGTENWAFASWAKAFTAKRELAFRAGQAENLLETFNAGYPVFAAMLIFMVFMTLNDPTMTTGDFLAFYTAFTLLLTAAFEMTAALMEALTIVPIYERMKPILQTMPEVDVAQNDPGILTGHIEMSKVMFRYQENGPLILNGVSLQIKPGQFVAFVGPSGSGKSTILRLLLGFEEPEAGSVYYDRQDLYMLDIQAVRRQIGTVLQSGRLMPGDIASNIIGSYPLTIDDAWKAAHKAGLAEDIERMPMGMHTVISEGATTFSGGQRQRLLIARAIVHQPRILFFDEATSALDNKTQAIVSQSLEDLQATRIVIAHRLSTIQNADQIFVIDAGQVVQQGTYSELINQSGLFAELAKRQLA